MSVVTVTAFPSLFNRGPPTAHPTHPVERLLPPVHPRLGTTAVNNKINKITKKVIIYYDTLNVNDLVK